MNVLSQKMNEEFMSQALDRFKVNVTLTLDKRSLVGDSPEALCFVLEQDTLSSA